MEKLLHLYKYVDGKNDAPFPSKEQQAILFEFKYDAKRMGNAPTITGTLMHPLCLDELWGNNQVYVSYNGEKYFLKQTPTSSYSNEDTRYKHEVDFVSERALLNDVYFYDVVTSDVSNDKPVSNSSNVVFYGDIHELAKRLNYSLQYANLEYSVVVDEGITSESKLVSFQKQFFANVLQEGYKLFEIPYYFEGKVIHFGYTNNTIDRIFSYGAKDALLSISKNNITQRIVNRITGVGSADNIPYYYPNFDPKGVSEVLYNGKVNDLVSVENLIKYKKVKLGDTFIYNYESDKVVEYVDKSKYVVSKDITLLSENYETTKRYELVLDFPFSVNIAPQSSIIELNYSKTFLTNFKARLYRNLELRDTFTSFGEIPYYRLIEGEYNFSISLEFTFGEFDEKTELTESDIPSIVDALTISITSDVYGFEQWTLNTANNIVKLNDYGLKLNTSPKNGDKITFKQLSYIPPQPNLMPPIYRETLGAERFYNALNDTYYNKDNNAFYSFENPFIKGKNKEDDVSFEDIKPSIKGVTNSYYERIDMFSEFAWDENDNDEFDEEGNYLHPYFFGKLRQFDGDFGFNLFDHAIEEDEMVISMTSGSCGGCNFIIGVDNESQKNIVQVDENGNLKRDANGNVLYGSPQERQNDTSKYEVWVALKKDIETFGVIMPNATNNYRPSAGDTFVILHIDLPNAYILATEERLREELIKYMKENNSEKFNFSLSFSRIFFAENPTILAQLNENARIKIAYNNNAYTLYVSSYSYSMNADDALPEIRVELSEELAIVKESIVKQLANASLYLNKEVQRVNTSVATTNTTISKNTATAQASITKTNARVENVEKVVMNLQSNSGSGGGQGSINEEQLENYLTTNQYAKKSDIPSLDAYAKSDDVANTYATKSALQTLQNEHNALNTKVTDLDNLLNSDTSGVIDTWNEVVAFLDGYSQSDDLAAILSGMNEDISNRVLTTDFEKANDSIKDLLSYFDATGNANNALKLGGHSAEYFATATAVNTLTTNLNSLTLRVSTNEQGITTNKNNIATLVEQVNGLADDVEILKGYWYIDNNGNLHTTHNIVVEGGGAFGKGSGGGGDVPSGGGIDETQLWNILGTSGTQTIHSSHIPDLSGKYLPLSGGKMTGTITVGDFTAFGQTGGNFYLGTPAYPLLLRSNGTTTINGNTLIHSGNIGDQSVDTATRLVRVGSITDANTITFTDYSLRWYSGIANTATNLPSFSGYQNGLLALPLHSSGTTAQIYMTAGNSLYFRGNTGADWKAIAFTDSNVASADYATTAGSAKASDVYAWAKKSSLAAADVPNLDWSKITSGKPTTLAGYGITNATSVYNSGSYVYINASGRYIVHYGDDSDWRLTSKNWAAEYKILHSGNYSSYALPLSGGTISSGAFSPLTIKGDNSYVGIGFQKTGDSKPSYLVYVNEWDWRITNVNWADSKKILHSGNYSSYALPLSGGTLKDSAGLPLVLNTSSSTSVELRLQIQGSNRVQLGYNTTDGVFIGAPALGYRIGITTGGTPIFYNGANRTLIHSGNIGSYSMVYDRSADGEYASSTKFNTVGYGNTALDSGWKTYGPILTFGIGAYHAQLQKVYNSDTLYIRSWINGAYTDWKTIAFTDSNVASATKLQTARTIWGKSFDGTGNVDGNFTMSNKLLIYPGTNLFVFGNETTDTYLRGNNVRLQYGSSAEQGLILNSSGNVLIGTTSDNGGRLQVAGGPVKVLMASSLDDAMFYGERTDLGYRIGIGVGASANRGIYDTKLGWCFKIDTGNNLSIVGHTVTGNLTVTGGGAFGSDIRYKNITSYRQLDLETIVNAPLFTFRWTDREDKVEHFGTSAQYWLGTQAKDAVNTANKDFFHLDYGALGVGIGISVAREVKGVKNRVELLEEEVKQLKQELAQYRRA